VPPSAPIVPGPVTDQPSTPATSPPAQAPADGWPDPSQTQAPNQASAGAAATGAQLDEGNWTAAASGMWDSLVDMAQGLVNMSLMPFGLFGPLAPNLNWAKAGPPAATGDPIRDAELLDNYRAGGWVTTTVSLAAPIGAEGILDSALSAATKFPALEGMGMGGGGRLIGATEQWLSAVGETTASLAPELATEGTGIVEGSAENPVLGREMQNALPPNEFEGPGEKLDSMSPGNMTEAAAAYQEKVTGLPRGKAYFVRDADGIPVEFDGPPRMANLLRQSIIWTTVFTREV
jgi:hypothetical protein